MLASVRNTSVAIATRYGPDGSGIESREGDFPHPSRSVLWPTQPPIQWASGLFPGDKVAGAWRWPPTPSSAEVKATPLLRFRAFMACSSVTFTFTYVTFLVTATLSQWKSRVWLFPANYTHTRRKILTGQNRSARTKKLSHCLNFSSYLTENRFRLHRKTQPIKSVSANSPFYRKNHTESIYKRWANCTVPQC
jgi:hypothetical protein